jgi:hypothetical protein
VASGADSDVSTVANALAGSAEARPTRNFLLEDLRFQNAPAGASLVEMRISNVDDLLYVTVNGIRRKVSHVADGDLGVRIPVSEWFGGGINRVRLQNVNTNGSTSYQFELWVDGQQVINDVAPGSVSTRGIAVDKTLTVSTPNRPAFSSVAFTSSTPGRLYVNGVYAGVSTPTSLSLPQGGYTFGLGVSTEAPFSYTGAFYEQAVSVTPGVSSVNLTARSPLPVQKTSSMVIVPVQNTYNYVTGLGADASNNGVLAPTDVTLFSGQVTATRDMWLEPFSYGLTTWSIDVWPMVANVPLVENSPDGIDLDGFIDAAGLGALRKQYDCIIVYFSQQRADGTDVADAYGSVFALGRQLIGFQRSYAAGTAPSTPNPYFFHETLHHLEWYSENILHLYTGAAGLHGANQHGYYSEESSGESDFLRFYRVFVRGQLAELDAFRPDLSYPSIPSTSDLYTGVFQALRVFTGR